ncbi:MAG: hypothetical protein LQ351_007947 [Letrouitia transgressa]|nr:MAG: hypothetical protein LQ351_007947 [Letrouitia transgressa]
MEDTVGGNLAEMMQRTSLCVSGPHPGVAAHHGDEGFREIVEEHFTAAENNAVERLVQLKQKLNDASTYDFWALLMEGMTSITGAQYGFVTKRILVDDQDSAVEMPPIGEPGSCLLGVAFYYNDGRELVNLHRDFKYLAYGAPCHNMKHDKVFLIPNKLNEFVLNNPNSFPFPSEAYIGVPLFADGKCFGHFGMMWNEEGCKRRDLSWAYIEMLLHSLEDVILQRLEEGKGFSKTSEGGKNAKIIPAEAVTAQQSLKPYARSLSHELRTPMQGVVGMLDVMHATVQESLEGQTDSMIRKIFKTLRDNIEVVQDSSRRAVEAADNVVHAYDLNMQVPDTPVPANDDDSMDSQPPITAGDRRPNIVIEGNSISFKRSKRRRTTSAEVERPATKHRHIQSKSSTPLRAVSPHTASLRTAVEESDSITGRKTRIRSQRKTGTPTDSKTPEVIDEMALDTSEPESAATPGLRHTRVRELLHLIVNESLRVGGRPESAVAEDTDGGEVIEVRTRNSNGKILSKIVEWSVDGQVPDTIFADERDLAKLVSCVFLNAIKFTEQGKVKLTAALSPKSRFIVINVEDTGPGIPQAFLPYLFKPFSREDDSLTRQKEGLGLGLLVAKGLARRIGGDLICLRSDTSGPQKGTEFEIRVPISPSDTTSRTSTPTTTPSPSRASLDRPPILDQRGRQAASLDRRRAPRLSSPSRSIKTPEKTLLRKSAMPLHPSSPSRRNSISQGHSSPTRRPSTKKTYTFDRNLAKKYPLTFLVAEDNKINRKLLVNMLNKLGYYDVYEAHDGAEAVHQMSIDRVAHKEKPVDVVLMDLWMPTMDGYEAAEHIFAIQKQRRSQGISRENDDDRARRKPGVTILAVSADVTDSALERASEVGMEGFMTKPYKLMDLERLILEYCAGEIATSK